MCLYVTMSLFSVYYNTHQILKLEVNQNSFFPAIEAIYVHVLHNSIT